KSLCEGKFLDDIGHFVGFSRPFVSHHVYKVLARYGAENSQNYDPIWKNGEKIGDENIGIRGIERYVDDEGYLIISEDDVKQSSPIQDDLYRELLKLIVFKNTSNCSLQNITNSIQIYERYVLNVENNAEITLSNPFDININFNRKKEVIDDLIFHYNNRDAKSFKTNNNTLLLIVPIAAKLTFNFN
ncbi:MAG: hypothetical protein AAF195_00920, partial [Pseudomonadota bacterium]